VLSEANQRLTTVILNLIVIQHQSFDVPVIYSHSLRVPLMAGPLCLAFFCVGLDDMSMFDNLQTEIISPFINIFIFDRNLLLNIGGLNNV